MLCDCANLCPAPKVVQQPIDWTQKKSFGKVPDYLSQRKEQIRAEYELLKNLRQSEVQQAEDKKMYSCLPLRPSLVRAALSVLLCPRYSVRAALRACACVRGT